jgi:2-polyprenyl-3-methyl-5-hydroxy-6-metoxy-1,4-benzoquinol methylase
VSAPAANVTSPSLQRVRTALRDARAAAYERARPEILEHVPLTATRVLDLGCATGTTGKALKARQPAHVTGIEIEPEYAREAERNLDRVIVGDVAQPPKILGTYDTLIAADVLEHLVDPWAALKHYTHLLEPGATAVVSLPNVAHWSTYAYLLRGTWPRKPEGIFDATHLRWFTLKDATAMLEQAELRPTAVVKRRWMLHRGSRFDRFAPPLTAFTFQHVIAAKYAPA